MPRLFARSLSLKVIALVTSVAVCIFAGLFAGNSYWQRQGLLAEMESASQRTLKLAQMAINKPMALGDNQGTLDQFRLMGRDFQGIQIYLTDYKGSVTYATEERNARKPIKALVSDPAFQEMFDQSLAVGLNGGRMLRIEGVPYFVELLAVKNEPACHHCHGSSRRILGSLVTLLDVRAEIQGLHRIERNSALISFVGLALLIGLLFLFMQRSVIRRVKILASASGAVRSGDLDVRFEDKGQDELSDLAGNLAEMVYELKHKMTAVECNERLASDEAKRANLAVEEADEAQEKARNLAEYQRQEVESLAVILQRVAKGDLTASYTASAAGANAGEAYDSFKNVEKAMAATMSVLRVMLGDIKQSSQALLGVVKEMSSMSGALSDASDKLAGQASAVASSSDEISYNITAMAAVTEEVSVNIASVSSTADQMSQAMNSVTSSVQALRDAILTISENAAEGATVASEAKTLAGEATHAMSELGQAAQAIGKVTEMIKRIAEQTNLLALNATIEAASAGDAGRGFAVVAHEIKELANQSAKAAEDIAAKISGVQSNTGMAVKVINRVVGIIGHINETVGEVRGSVEAQTRSAAAITQNVGEANKGVSTISSSIAELSKAANDMSLNAGEMAKGAGHVAASVQNVSKSVEVANASAKQVNRLSERLAEVAVQLQRRADAFVAEKK